MGADIINVQRWHVRYVATNCRQSDRNELMAIAGVDPFKAIMGGVEIGTSWTGMINDHPVCIFGVCPVGGMLTEMGRPWMVATDLIEKHAMAFLRRNKPYIKKMLEKYSYLSNYVDCRNTKAIEWLKWLGFKFNEPELFGVYQIPFMRFEMRN